MERVQAAAHTPAAYPQTGTKPRQEGRRDQDGKPEFAGIIGLRWHYNQTTGASWRRFKPQKEEQRQGQKHGVDGVGREDREDKDSSDATLSLTQARQLCSAKAGAGSDGLRRQQQPLMLQHTVKRASDAAKLTLGCSVGPLQARMGIWLGSHPST